MSSKFEILAGPAMSGKTYKLCERVLQEAHDNPQKSFIVVVPEQAGNAYEKKLIEMSRNMFGAPGFLNIDILGFNRLGYRIFEEFGVKETAVLEEYEKNMLVRVAAGKVSEELSVYSASVGRTGFISDVKSLVSEMIQYNVTPDDLDQCISQLAGENPSLSTKLEDIAKIYREFMNILSERTTALSIDPTEKGITISEERLKLLIRLLSKDKKCSITDGTVFFFDEFRGYTPDQLGVIGVLSKRAESMTFGICIDEALASPNVVVPEHDIFRQSSATIRSLQLHIGYAPDIKTVSRLEEGPQDLRNLSQHIFRYPIVEYRPQVGDIQGLEVFYTDTLSDEIRILAETIRQEVKEGYRYKDIYVVTGDMESFAQHAERVFREYEIPLFCDYSRKLRKNPYTEAVLKLLGIIDRDFDYDSIFGFIKTGIIPIEDKHSLDELENYVLRTGIRGRKLWSKTIRPYGRNVTKEKEEECKRLDGIRKQILEVLEPVIRLNKDSSKVSDIIIAIREVLEKLDVKSQMEESAKLLKEEDMLAESRVMDRLYDLLDKLFLQTEELLGNQEMSIHDFVDILSSGIGEIGVGVIPPTIDMVSACDVDRSRIVDAKVVHFINMNTGIVPTTRRSGTILSDRDKDKVTACLEDMGTGKTLATNEVCQSIDELFLIYQILSKATEKLTLSYFMKDDVGNSIEPSYLVGRICRLFPELEISYKEPSKLRGTKVSDRLDFIGWVRQALEQQQVEGVINEELLDDIVKYIYFVKQKDIPDKNMLLPALNFSNPSEVISQEVMNNIKLRLSVSQMESYSGCPYSYFMSYILRLKDRPEKKIEYYDVGNTVHDALDKTFKEMELEGKDWTQIEDAELLEKMRKNVDISWSEILMEEDPDGKSLIAKDKINELADRTILTLRNHIKAGSLRPGYFEQEFTAEFTANKPDGTEVPVIIKGKVDRLDTCEEDGKIYIRVIDYKTGSQTFNLEDIQEGTAIQLLLYTKLVTNILRNMNQDKEVIPMGMYYYSVKSPILDLKKDIDESSEAELAKLETEIKKQLKLDGLFNSEPIKLLNMQDEGIVPEEGAMPTRESMVLPIREDGRNHAIKYDGGVSGEALEKLGDYSAEKLKESADKILSGTFPKSPIKSPKAQDPKCSYCDYKPVCRFSDYAGKIRNVEKLKTSVAETVKGMVEEVDGVENKVELRDSKFIKN